MNVDLRTSHCICMPDYTLRSAYFVCIMTLSAIVQRQVHALAKAFVIFLCPAGQVCGLPTNLEFLKRCAAHEAFAAADLDTGFIGRHLRDLLRPVALDAKVSSLQLSPLHVVAFSTLGVKIAISAGGQGRPGMNDCHKK